MGKSLRSLTFKSLKFIRGHFRNSGLAISSLNSSKLEATMHVRTLPTTSSPLGAP